MWGTTSTGCGSSSARDMRPCSRTSARLSVWQGACRPSVAVGWGTRTSAGRGPLWGHKNGLHMGDRLAGVHGGSCVSDLSTGGEGCRLHNRSPQSWEKGLVWGCPSLVTAGPRPAVQVRLSSHLDETVAEGQDKGHEKGHEEGGAQGT